MENDKTSFKEFPTLIMKGFLMGAADVVPGVSGGTMALILGIYQRLLDAIKSVGKDALSKLITFKFQSFFNLFHWKFIFGLLIGIGSAIIFFTKIIALPELMFTDPEPIYGLYFGLILGSIFLLIRGLKQLNIKSIVAILVGSLIGWWIVNLVPDQTPETLPFIFLSGSLAICAMILPGISGSFILLILGKYQFILSQIAEIGGDETSSAIIILGTFIVGMIVGISLFSRLLSWFLDHFYSTTICILIGFLIGSLSVIWPFQERTYVEIERTEIISEREVKAKWSAISSEDRTKPTYYKLGKEVTNDDNSSEKQFELIRVKRKLISSDPFFPSFQNLNNESRLSDGKWSLYWGFITIFIGLLFVIALEKLSKSEE